MPDDKDTSGAFSLPEALNDLAGRIAELLGAEDVDADRLGRTFALRERLVGPACSHLAESGKAKEADLVKRLFLAAEEYAVCFNAQPEGRDERRKRAEALLGRVRRELLAGQDRQGEMEQLLDDIRRWQWKATLDANGRIAFATGSGASVPPRGAILHEVGPAVIEQAIKAQRPYADAVRPRDARGEPGGLVNIRGARRLLAVGDLHGRYDNLEAILRDKDNLRSVIEGDAHLVFLGDAVHPPSSLFNTDKHYEDSFAVMLLIMTLKAENPFNVHYILGNHDNAHAGGPPVGRRSVRQDSDFERFIRRRIAPSVLDRYREFVLNCPAAVRAFAPGGAILIVHATLSDRILNEEGLVNVFAKGRLSPALNDLLWSRDFHPARIEGLASRVGCRFVLGGHTPPTPKRAAHYGFAAIGPPAFGLVGDVQMILNAQARAFGYMDIDLSRPLPQSVTELAAPDGAYACRMLQPKDKPPGA